MENKKTSTKAYLKSEPLSKENSFANKKSNNSTLLSGKRTELSNIRTILSFFQSAIACLSVAFAFMKLDKKNPIDPFTICLFVASVFFLVFGICIFIKTKKHIKNLELNK